METSQHSLNESFSSVWSINVKSSSDSVDGSGSHRSFDDGSFIEMDPHFLSLRWMNDKDFGFDLPRSRSSALVGAEQIFSDGALLPFNVSNSPTGQAEASMSMNSSALSRSLSYNIDSSKAVISRNSRRRAPSGDASSSSSPLFHSSQSTPSSMSLCSTQSTLASRSEKFIRTPFVVKSPKKVLSKYLSYLMPLCGKVKGLNLISFKTSSRSCKADHSVRSSARTSIVFSGFECCCSNADISIYDAILYCKRSNGQD